MKTKRGKKSFHLDNDQAWLEVGVVVLDLLHLEVDLKPLLPTRSEI